ncbi:hypothetical protein ABK040_012758 [Willaertia magna]
MPKQKGQKGRKPSGSSGEKSQKNKKDNGVKPPPTIITSQQPPSNEIPLDRNTLNNKKSILKNQKKAFRVLVIFRKDVKYSNEISNSNFEITFFYNENTFLNNNYNENIKFDKKLNNINYIDNSDSSDNEKISNSYVYNLFRKISFTLKKRKKKLNYNKEEPIDLNLRHYNYYNLFVSVYFKIKNLFSLKNIIIFDEMSNIFKYKNKVVTDNDNIKDEGYCNNNNENNNYKSATFIVGIKCNSIKLLFYSISHQQQTIKKIKNKNMIEQKNIKVQESNCYTFNILFNTQQDSPFDIRLLKKKLPKDWKFTAITSKEVEIFTKKLKNSMQGIDNISVNLLKNLDNEMYNTLAFHYNEWLSRKDIPSSLKLLLLPKIPVLNNFKDYRSIVVLLILYRLFATIINNQLMDICEDYNIISDCQRGLRRKASTLDQLIVVRTVIDEYLFKKKPIFTTTLNIKNAYGSVLFDKFKQILNYFRIHSSAN